VKTLKNCVKLSSRVTIYVPATHDVNHATDNTAQVDRVASVLSECFGGATSTPAIGYWVSPVAGLVRENTTVVFSYATEQALKASIDRIITLCEELRDTMKQESVALDVNGEMYFI
jgi:hypothetical protein